MAVDEEARMQRPHEVHGLKERYRRALGTKGDAEVGHEGVADEDDAARGEMDHEGVLGFAAVHRVQDELGASHRQPLALTDEASRDDLVASLSLPPKKVA